MTQFPRKFFALLAADAITILVAATLLLRNIWQPALGIMAALFVANIFLAPSLLRVQRGETQVSGRGRSKLWFLGLALMASAFIRLALFMQSGFSWPGLAGVIAGVTLGTLFLLVARNRKEMTH